MNAIQDGGKLAGEGVASYIFVSKNLRIMPTVLTGIALGVGSASAELGMLEHFTKATLGKPSLVREALRLSPTVSVQRLLGASALFWKRVSTSNCSEFLSLLLMPKTLRALQVSISAWASQLR